MSFVVVGTKSEARKRPDHLGHPITLTLWVSSNGEESEQEEIKLKLYEGVTQDLIEKLTQSQRRISK